MSKIKPLPCAYCGGEVHDAPLPIQAVCWRCWWDLYGEQEAVKRWRLKHWWRRLVP